MKNLRCFRLVITAGFMVFVIAVSFSCRGEKINLPEKIIGAWKSKVQFKTGTFAAVEDLEFMYVFNKGGTMTESSNYDGAPPVPPAYGIWRKNSEKSFEVKYEFFTTSPPASFDNLKSSGGFSPAGYGIITEEITFNDDMNSFSSNITMALFDKSGNHIGVDEAKAVALKMEF